MRDETQSFIKSGIISITLLDEGNTTSNLFLDNPSLYWLQVSLPNYVSAACQTLSVTPQAATAVYHSGADPSTHFNSPLPASTITKTVVPISGLLKVVGRSGAPATSQLKPNGGGRGSTRFLIPDRHRDRYGARRLTRRGGRGCPKYRKPKRSNEGVQART